MRKTIATSFTKALMEIQKEFPVLRQGHEVKVKISVRALVQIGQRFHKKGWDDNDWFL